MLVLVIVANQRQGMRVGRPVFSVSHLDLFLKNADKFSKKKDRLWLCSIKSDPLVGSNDKKCIELKPK